MYAIKTSRGYVARRQLMKPQSNREITFTPERASAKWYCTYGLAFHAAWKSYKLGGNFQIQADYE